MPEKRSERNDLFPIDRRSLLRSVAGLSAAGLAGLAGCTGDGSDGNDSDGGGGGTSTETGGADGGGSDGGAGGDDGASGTEGDTDGTSDGDQGEGIGGDEGDSDGFVDEVDGQVELAYGDVAELSNGIEVTVHGISFESQMGEEVPEEGEAFALVQTEAFNGGDSQARLPAATDPGIFVLFEDQQVQPVFNYGAFSATDYQSYEGDEVQSGVRREGSILFEVAGELDQSSVDVLWQDEIFVAEELDGAINVLWTSG